jgi:AcrR family transcriptional regulator
MSRRSQVPRKDSARSVMASEAVERQSYHVGNLRESLIEQALALLESGGLEGLSLRKVAAAAGVSHTAAYRHFDDKNALLAAVAEEGFRLLYDYQRRVVAEAGDDLTERFLNLGWLYVKFTIEYPQHARIMFGGAGLEFKLYPALLAAAAKTFRQLLEVVRRGQEQGVIAAGSSKHRALAAWAIVHGVAMLVLDGQIHLRGDAADTEKTVKSVISILFHGLAARPGT